MHYTIGQIVRTHPDQDGNFVVYRVTTTGLGLGRMLEVEELNQTENVERLSCHPDTIELFAYVHNAGSYQIGDTVRLFGHEGTWQVMYFHESRLHNELLVVCENTAGAVQVVPAQYAKTLI